MVISPEPATSGCGWFGIAIGRNYNAGSLSKCYCLMIVSAPAFRLFKHEGLMNTRIIQIFVATSMLATFAYPNRAQEENKLPSDKIAQTRYTVTDLGLVGPSPGPLVITKDGLIAESVAVSNGWHAAISFLGKTPVDLAKAGGLGGPNSAAFGVNEF